MPPRDAPARRALGGGRGPQLRPAAAAKAGRRAARAHAALHAPRRVRRAAGGAAPAWASACARSPRGRGSPSTSTRTTTSTARRRPGPGSPSTARTRWRSPAGTARGSCSGVLVTDAELEPTHADPGAAGLGRLRIVPGLHRRLPDRRDRRRRRARRPPLPVVALAVAPGRAARTRPRSATASTAATSARTCARGTRAPTAARPTREPDAVDDAFPPLREWLEADPDALADALPAPVHPRPRRPPPAAKRPRRAREPQPRLGDAAVNSRSSAEAASATWLADAGGLEHLGVAAVAQDLRDQPRARAVGHVGHRGAVLERPRAGPALELPARPLGREPHPGDAHVAAERVVEIAHLGARLVAAVGEAAPP